MTITPNQIMLDLETLDTKPTGIILSIGMARFDPSLDSPIVGTFYRVLSIGDQEENERTVSPETTAWWAAQSPEAGEVLQKAMHSEHDVHEQLIEVSDWMGTNPTIWGNGADFDNVLLASLFSTYELKQPWHHQNNRCYRTLKAIFDHRYEPESARRRALGDPPPRDGLKHHALDDAVYQARMASWMIWAL